MLYEIKKENEMKKKPLKGIAEYLIPPISIAKLEIAGTAYQR